MRTLGQNTHPGLVITATFIRVGPCAKTRQKANERIPGWFRANDRDLGIFAQDEL
jgi:hypothetical protein